MESTVTITGLAGNVKLRKIYKRWLESAVATFNATGENVRIFHSFQYKAQSWKHQQRVLVKIEANKLGTNVRFVVSDFKHQRSDFLYSDCYCDRGRMEKLLLNAVSIDEKKTFVRLRFSKKAPMIPEILTVLTRLQHLPPS